MELKINHKKLTDSPYNRNVDSIFQFVDVEVEDFVNDIKYLSEGCYYISGYRGAGKTSFVKKIEEELSKSKDEIFLFVHVNVSKFDKYEILIRSFIRQFYFQFAEQKVARGKTSNTTESNELKKLEENLKDLHERTFNHLTHEKSKTEKEVVKEVFTVAADLKKFITSILTLIIILVYQLTEILPRIVFDWALFLLAGTLFVLEAVKFTNKSEESNITEDSTKNNLKSFYDDDIAEYRFKELLRDFKKSSSNKIRLVFVIDELDKLSVKDAKKFLSLFKNTLLSGDANFIIVGGQELYYELYLSEGTEDTVLSTLFSKHKHISLKSTSELRILFERLVLNIDECRGENVDQRPLDDYIASLIIRSKRIPRKLMNLIKEDLKWRNEEAYISISDLYAKPANVEMLSVIDSVCENSIKKSTTSEPIVDYYTTRLFTEWKNILACKSEEELDSYFNSFYLYQI